MIKITYNINKNIYNKSSLVLLRTSPTQEELRCAFEIALKSKADKKYSTEFLDRYYQLSNDIEAVEAFKGCSTQWQIKTSKTTDNVYYSLNSCHKKGCPCCSRKSLLGLVHKYLPLFEGETKVRFFTPTWEKKVMTKEEYKRRKDNIEEFDRRLKRYGYFVNASIRSLKYTFKLTLII